MTPWQVCSSNSPPRHSQLGVHELSPLMPPQQRDCSTPQSSTSGGGSGSKIHVRSFRGTTSLRDDVPCSLQETSGHVRVMCPGLDASASFHMTNAQLGNVVTVGFLQVVDEHTVTATYASPSETRQYSVVPIGNCRKSSGTTTPFYGPASAVARIRDVSSTSSTPFEENSHQTSFYGFSSVHGSNRDDAIGTRTTAPQQVRITDEPAFELPWSVRGISTDDVVQEGMTSPGGKRCEHSTKPASSSERLDLMAVQYQSRSTTWLAVHDHHSRTLVPVSAIQQVTDFQLDVLPCQPPGQRVHVAPGHVTRIDCLSRVPNIPAAVLQKCRRPTGHADGASLNWHGKWSGCVALQQLRCPPSLDSSEVTSTSQAARRTTTVSLATPCRQRRGPTDASLGHRQKHGQHSKKIKSPKVAKDCPEVAPSSQKISSISHRLCHLLRF